MIDSQSHETVSHGSNRSFGLLFAFVFMVVGLFPLWGGGNVRLWSLVIAGTFLLASIVAPRILAPLNALWFKFGMMLGAVVAPIVMFLLYAVAFTPVALLSRLLGRDPLRLKLDRKAASYWIERKEPVGPMREQF